MTSEHREQIVANLLQKQDRHFVNGEQIDSNVAFQIQAMRVARGWTQEELGQRAGMTQSRISAIENPDYGRFTIETLKRIAEAFDVALIVKYAPFSELADWLTSLSPESLAPPSFEDDLGLRRAEAQGGVTTTQSVLIPTLDRADHGARSFTVSIKSSAVPQSSVTTKAKHAVSTENELARAA